jgi:acyl-CoA thioesterase FadM
MFSEHIGNKSFTLSYELMVKGQLYAKGRSVLVCFDAVAQETIAVPEAMREALSWLIRE